MLINDRCSGTYAPNLGYLIIAYLLFTQSSQLNILLTPNNSGAVAF